MKDKIYSFETEMEMMLSSFQEKIKTHLDESKSYVFSSENEVTGMKAYLEKLQVDYDKLKSENRKLSLEKGDLIKKLQHRTEEMIMLKDRLGAEHGITRKEYNQLASEKKLLEEENKRLMADNRELTTRNKIIMGRTKVSCEEKDILPATMVTKQSSYSEVIEKLIYEAEQYPSNQNDKAEAIKGVIQSLILGEGIELSAELKKRLQSLGRKETAMAHSLVEVKGNDKVIFGGTSNG